MSENITFPQLRWRAVTRTKSIVVDSKPVCLSQQWYMSMLQIQSFFSPGLLIQKEHELEDLKQKVAEAMALMPPSSYNTTAAGSAAVAGGESPHFSAKFASPSASPPKEEDVLAMSSLNPNASDYTPKTPSSP